MAYLCGCCVNSESESSRKIGRILEFFFEKSLEVVCEMTESEEGRVVLQSLVITLCVPFLTCCI